ncbi:hypothetical protein SAY86_016088 [Trapa natans]|uniref:Pentatricopeptide repeat-containing protein n=1 Tax=Trapa natans TaxID=22666 RepID=A0AAN7LJN7_TRANT|nr:hypothetical protein SAY86_016088 [Trapa natans]
MLHPQGLKPFPHFLLLQPPPISASLLATIASLFSLCTSSRHLQQVHSRFILHGLHRNPSLSSQLMDRYASLGFLELSEDIFRSFRNNPSVAVYSSMLRNLCKRGEFGRVLSLYRETATNEVFLDVDSYSFVLESCACLSDVESGMRIHGKLVKLGLDSSDSVAAALLEMYTNCGEISTQQVDLETSTMKDPKMGWNSLIHDASRDGNPEAVFVIFKRMRSEGCLFNPGTVVTLLRSCVEMSDLEIGRLVHSLAVVSNLSNNLSVNTALLSLYSKLGSLDTMQMLFDKMPDRDCVVWNITLSAYTQNGYPEKSLDLFHSMVRSGLRPDLFTLMALVPALSQMKSFGHGKELHTCVLRNHLDYQVSVLNAIIGMYCDCSCINYALKVFNVLADDKTNVSWSTMIKGYVANDQFLDAVSLFSRMRSEGAEVDFVTVINILPAYVSMGALEQVKNLQGYTIKLGLNSLPSVITAFFVSYAKSGSIKMAKRLFDAEGDKCRSKDIILWNAMIGAYAKHGDCHECFDLYSKMKQSELRPDHVTFLGLLTACVNSGRIEEGKEYFREMTSTYGLVPGREHYASMVDLLGRSGRVDEARELISSLPFEPDARVWGPLLSACRAQAETRLAELAAEKLIGIEPTNAGNYVLLSNVYAASGKWDGVAKMRRFLRDKSLKKNPGCSWVEVNGKVTEFRVADRSHGNWEDIYGLLQTLELEIRVEE